MFTEYSAFLSKGLWEGARASEFREVVGSEVLLSALGQVLPAQTELLEKSLIVSQINGTAEYNKEVVGRHPPLLLFTNVIFEVTSILSRDKGDGKAVAAETLARALVEFLKQHYRDEESFSLIVGGGGYINAIVSRALEMRFLKALKVSASTVLFSRKSFLFPCDSWGFVGGDRLDSALNINWKEVFERAKDSKNQDIEELLSMRPITGRPLSDDALMLLALLGDKELELKPYRQGVCGQQNVPWFFRQFFKDAKNYIAMLKKQLPRNKFDEDDFSAGSGSFSYPLQQAARLLFTFRKALEMWTRQQRPERFVRFLTEMVRAFYAVYNTPERRMLPLVGENCREITTVCLLCEQLNEAICRGFNAVQDASQGFGDAGKDS